MEDLISIIVPVYKVESYINRCVDSILRQTYIKLEIILVDDGSPDRCGEICDKYAEQDNRIKVVHKKNGGLSDARNVGIDISHGDYISFIDSDDWIHDDYIEKLYQLLKKTDADISVCNFMKTETETFENKITNQKIYEYSNIEAIGQLTDRFYLQMTTSWGKLYKKNLFDDTRFPIGRIHEDEFTTYKTIFKSKKIVLTTAQLYYYWQREDSIMGNSFNLKSRLDVIDAMEERANFLDKIEQTEFRDKTYFKIFNVYTTVEDRIDLFEEIEDKVTFKKNFEEFKAYLRKNNKNILHRIYYEIYNMMPNVVNKTLKIYRSIK